MALEKPIYSTTTRCLGKRDVIDNLKKGLKIIEASKFDHANFYFAEIQSCLDRDDYQDIITGMIADCNLVFNTAHAPIHFPFFFSDYARWDKKELYEKRILRSIIAAKSMNAKWIVIHVGSALDVTGHYDFKESVSQNIQYLNKFVDCAAQHNIGIAIENGTNMEEEVTPTIDELIEITDYYNDLYAKEIMGICFDFGHANVGRLDIYHEIQKIGKRLKVTHIHDNQGSDTHSFPYQGNVDWSTVRKALFDAHYNGDFTLELIYKDQFFTKNILNETYRLLTRITQGK